MLCRGWRRAAAVALGLSIARVSAAEPSTEERARLPVLLRTGADAAKAKNWKGCVDALRAALAIEDAARTAGDLGLCEEQAGRFGDAMTHVRRALAETTPEMRKNEPWKGYQAAAERLASQVASVVLTLRPSHARVVVDGRPHGKADGHTLFLDYGKHTFVARAEGHEDASETRLVTPGGVPHVHLRLKPKAGAPASPLPETPSAPRTAASPPTAGAATPPPPADTPSPASFPCLPAWSARGVLVPLACAGAATFAASAAAAIGLEVHARSMRAALDARGFGASACAPGQARAGSAECKELAHRFQLRDDAANVLVGTGIVAGVLAASAGLSVALSPSGRQTKEANVTVAASPSTSGGVLVIRGAW